MQNRSIVITRGHIAQLGALIGGLGILSGILSFIWYSHINGVVALAFGIGIAGLGLWAVVMPEDFANFIRGRQARRGTMSIFSTLLIIGIVALLYIIIQRQTITVDITAGERFSLSNETKELLRTVVLSTEPIQITGFYTAGEIQDRIIDDQYWRLYETDSAGKISRVYIDPEQQPALAQRYRGALEQGYKVFIAFLNDDGTVNYESTIIVGNSGQQERDMTEALSRLLISGTFTVYFETSLGTLSVQDTTTTQGLSVVNGVLRSNGLQTQPLELKTLAESGSLIPDDASAVLLPRPTRKLTEAEINVLDNYLQRGGRLFIFADIFLQSPDNFLAEDSAFSQYLWENYGIRALDAVVIDPVANVRTDTEIISAAVFSVVDIAANLNIEGDSDSVAAFNIARPLEVDNTPPVNNGKAVASSEYSWGEKNFAALAERNEYDYDEGEDIPGPLTTVAWAFDEVTGAKIILVGDSDFITDGQIHTPRGNAQLFLDGVGWLTGFTEKVSFKPQTFIYGLPIMFVEGQTLDAVAFVTIILMPGTMLVAAGAMWMRRRRR